MVKIVVVHRLHRLHRRIMKKQKKEERAKKEKASVMVGLARGGSAVETRPYLLVESSRAERVDGERGRCRRGSNQVNQRRNEAEERKETRQKEERARLQL